MSTPRRLALYHVALLCLAMLLVGSSAAPQSTSRHELPSEFARVTELLERTRARYADAHTYHDVARQRTTTPIDSGDFTRTYELVLAFERALVAPLPFERAVVHGDPGQLPHRWLVEKVSFGGWGLRKSTAHWSDGETFWRWFGEHSPLWERPLDHHALGNSPELLPLRWALAENVGLKAPLERFTLRRELGGAVVNGQRCLGVELRDGDEADAWELRLWIQPESALLRRLESARSFQGERFREVVDYQPRFDMQLPASALRFEEPARRFGLTLESQLRLLRGAITGACAFVCALLIWRRRTPVLRLPVTYVLPFGLHVLGDLVQASLRWWRTPGELDASSLASLGLFAFALVLIVGFCAWTVGFRWGTRGLSAKALRTAIETFVTQSGDVLAASRRRRFGRELWRVELPRSKLVLKLSEWGRTGVVSVSGRGSWSARCALRRQLEALLPERSWKSRALETGMLLAFGIFVSGGSLWLALP